MTSVLRKGPCGPAVGDVEADSSGQLWYFNGSLWVPTLTAPEDGQSPQWNAATEDWEFVAPPNLGSLEYFDTTFDPAGLWNFNGTLADSSGNGNDLILAAGNLAYCDITPGKLGLYVLESSRYQTIVLPPELLILGDLTIEVILQRDSPYTDTYAIATHGGNGALETENIAYSFSLPGSPTTALQRLQSVWERGAGVAVTQASTGNVSLPPIHNITYLSMTRASNVVQFYLNGLPFGPASATLQPPTGGAGAVRFIVGTSVPSGGSTSRFVIMSLKVIARALSDAEIKAEYNYTLGPAFGVLD